MHYLPHLRELATYTEYLQHLSYLKVFLVLIASGHIIPIPEGVTLVLLGYLAAMGKGKIFGLILVGIFSVTFFDMLMYTLSLEGSKLASSLANKVKAGLLERYANANTKTLLLFTVLSHFVPGWRFANPIIAGVTKVSWKKFLVFTLLAACIYAPLYILVGFAFKNHILLFIQTIQSLHRFFIPFFISVLAFVIALYIVLENKKSYNRTNAKK